MALFNEILVGRYNSILHKLLNMKEGAPAPTLASDVVATICLELDRPEWQFLGGEWFGSVFTSKIADAGNLSYMGIFNGAATGVLAIVEGILVTNINAAATTYNVVVGGTTGLTGTVRGNAHDRRFTKQSTCLVGSGVEAALTGSRIYQLTIPAGESRLMSFPVILPPTDVIPGLISNVTVTTAAINTEVRGSFFWREHQMEPSEAR